MSYARIGVRLGVTGPTVKKMISEANALRLKGQLYADMNAEEDDLYERASLPRRRNTLTMNGVSVA